MDPNPDDPLDTEVVKLVLNDLDEPEAESTGAIGATVHALDPPQSPDAELTEIYDYEGEGPRPEQRPRSAAGVGDPTSKSTGSIASTQSSGAIASVESVGAIASIRSTGSIASAMSAGSIASALSAGSIGSLASVGSLGSIFSVGSYRSILSIGSRNSILSIGAVDGFLTIGRGRNARSFGRR